MSNRKASCFTHIRSYQISSSLGTTKFEFPDEFTKLDILDLGKLYAGNGIYGTTGLDSIQLFLGIKSHLDQR